MSFIVQHPRTQMLIGRRELPQSERSIGAYKLVGAAGSYKWVRTEAEAEHFDREFKAKEAAIFVRCEDALIHECGRAS